MTARVPRRTYGGIDADKPGARCSTTHGSQPTDILVARHPAWGYPRRTRRVGAGRRPAGVRCHIGRWSSHLRADGTIREVIPYGRTIGCGVSPAELV